MQRKRRSGRIRKELPIVLLGTDTTGKVFSEETHTVVLSRHGAGVISRNRLAPDELMTLRLPDSTKEAVVRLVGQIGGEPGRYVYGLAFVDPDPNFWPMEFPPPESFESASFFMVLECSRCQARQNVEQHEIEEDVYSVNGNVLRYCESCGTSTQWKKAEGQATPASAPSKTSVELRPPSPAPRTPSADFDSPSFVETLEPALRASPAPATTRPISSYSATSVISEFASMAEAPTSPATASATAVLPPPEPQTSPPARQTALPSARPPDALARELDANGRPVNKRRHLRIRVSFGACVRHPAHADEVVECENVSKGGVCFHSLRQYPVGSFIELAAPFSPGEAALFVPAQIVRTEALSGGQVFRYGVEYLQPTVPADAS